ncbi:MAG: hypothetical protein KA190_24280 [Kofleriaceae bacterium]|nr:hypothetical protein [Kofleriaceae bacterium]
MDDDELKRMWAAGGADGTGPRPAVDAATLAARARAGAGAARRRYLWARGPELAFGALVLAAVVPVLLRHPGEVRYLVGAGPLVLLAAGLTAACAWLLVVGRSLDDTQPVARSQRVVLRLRRVELASFRWALLGGVLCWLPALLVAVEVVTGVPALARVDAGYLAANLGLGVLVLVGGTWGARRLVGTGATRSRLVDALTSRSLRRLDVHLAELADLAGGASDER